jgi:hypothetical protein
MKTKLLRIYYAICLAMLSLYVNAQDTFECAGVQFKVVSQFYRYAELIGYNPRATHMPPVLNVDAFNPYNPNDGQTYHVVQISAGAMRGCSLIQEVIVDGAVRVIPADAFRDCSNLKRVRIGGQTRNIRDNAFRNCTNLNNVSMTTSLEELGSGVFYGCSSLETISTMPAIEKTCGKEVFKYCTSLSDVKFEKIFKNLTEIPEGMFYGCRKLKNVTIPASITKVSKNAFAYCI